MTEPPNTEDEQQWWRVLYSNGSERIAGPWFPTKEEASEWALDSPLVSKRAMRSIRYEADVRSEPLESDPPGWGADRVCPETCG